MSFFQQLEQQHNIRLTEPQHEAVIDTQGHRLLLACPGSGKTTVMVVRTGYLIQEQGVDPGRILSLTFSKAAATGMKRRFERMFGDAHTHFSTIHSFCYGLMQRYFTHMGIRKENLEGQNRWNLTKGRILTQAYEHIVKSRPTEDDIEELSGSISYIKNLRLQPEAIAEKDFRIRHIKELYDAYEEAKEKHGLYDFDDMLLIGLQALTEMKDLRDRLRSQYQYIQIDEAQDNSRVQNDLIAQLIDGHNHLFMVADDDQTIYEWRGAYPEGVLNFDKEYPGARILRMEQNFRSSQDIVSCSNQFIKRNRLRFDKELMTQNPAYMPIAIVKAGDIRGQYEFILKYIREQKKDYRSYSVLFRNHLSTVLIADMFDREGIPFHTLGYKSHFFNHWVVADVRDFIRFAQEPENPVYFERIYYKNDAYISKKAFEWARRHGEGRNLLDALCQVPDLKDFQVQKLIQLKWQFKALEKKTMAQAIDYIETGLGYGGWLAQAGKMGVSYEGAMSILGILKGIAAPCLNFEIFSDRLDYLKNLLEGDRHRRTYEGVTLSTIHGAKGLEFQTVFMVDLIQGVFPTNESMEVLKLLEGERRLFYVGMTRAKYRLFLISNSVPSQFVREIDLLVNPEKLKVEAAPASHMDRKPYDMGMDQSAASAKHIDAGQLGEGLRVRHKHFGAGGIEVVEPNTVIILFDDGERRRFGLRFLIEKDLLEIE